MPKEFLFFICVNLWLESAPDSSAVSPPTQGCAEVNHPRQRDRGGCPTRDAECARLVLVRNAPPAAREFQRAESRKHHDLMPDFNSGAESQDREDECVRRHALHRFEERTGETEPVKQPEEKSDREPGPTARSLGPKNILE